MLLSRIFATRTRTLLVSSTALAISYYASPLILNLGSTQSRNMSNPADFPKVSHSFEGEVFRMPADRRLNGTGKDRC